jgi:hypothetical protein
MNNMEITCAMMGQAMLDEAKSGRKREYLTRKVGKNVDAVRKNYRLAESWSACAS